MTPLRDTVSSLYAELEKISREHEELTDTDVREALHEMLNYAFVWGRQTTRTPLRYRMFSAQGDAAVAAAVRRFLDAAIPAAEASAIDVGQARLDILQDESVKTPEGESFDLFIGQTDSPLPPEALSEDLFQPGEYDESSG